MTIDIGPSENEETMRALIGQCWSRKKPSSSFKFFKECHSFFDELEQIVIFTVQFDYKSNQHSMHPTINQILNQLRQIKQLTNQIRWIIWLDSTKMLNFIRFKSVLTIQTYYCFFSPFEHFKDKKDSFWLGNKSANLNFSQFFHSKNLPKLTFWWILCFIVSSPIFWFL